MRICEHLAVHNVAGNRSVKFLCNICGASGYGSAALCLGDSETESALDELRVALEKNTAFPRQPVQTFDPLLPNYARPELLPETMSNRDKIQEELDEVSVVYDGGDWTGFTVITGADGEPEIVEIESAHPAIPGLEHDPADWSKDVLVKAWQGAN